MYWLHCGDTHWCMYLFKCTGTLDPFYYLHHPRGAPFRPVPKLDVPEVCGI